MQTLLTFFMSPGKAFENLNSKPHWLTAFSIVVVGLVIITWLTSCWKNQSFLIQTDVILITLVIFSFIIFLAWSFISFFLYLAASLISVNSLIVYKRIFSVVSFCGIIFLIGEIINFLLIKF